MHLTMVGISLTLFIFLMSTRIESNNYSFGMYDAYCVKSICQLQHEIIVLWILAYCQMNFMILISWKIKKPVYVIKLDFASWITFYIDSFIIHLSFYFEIFIVHLFIGSKLKPFQPFIFEKTFTKKLCLQFFSHLSPP